MQQIYTRNSEMTVRRNLNPAFQRGNAFAEGSASMTPSQETPRYARNGKSIVLHRKIGIKTVIWSCI